MSAPFEGVIIVGASTLVSVAGIYLVRKSISRKQLEACHEVGGYLLAVVGTLYAILLGLIVVDAQSKVELARHMAACEANMLSNIYHLSRPFKQPGKQNIRDGLYEYALSVVNEDWSGIQQGKQAELSVAPYRALWRQITDYNPQNQNEQQCYSTMLTNMEELSQARRFRMVAAKSKLSALLWTVLLAGGVLIVLFTYFFFVESLLSQILMTAFVVIFVSMNIFLVYVFQNPYRPELGVKKVGFGYSFTPEWFHDDPKHPDKD